MICWLASHPRSGNTMLRTILNRSFGLKTWSVYDDKYDIAPNDTLATLVGHQSHGLRKQKFIDNANKSDELIVIKTHDLPVDSKDKIIYVVRDGRSSIISYFHYMKNFSRQPASVFDILMGRVMFGGWSDHVSRWALEERRNTLLVHYEKLAAGDEETLVNISNHLGADIMDRTRVTFSEMHNASPNFAPRGGNEENIKEMNDLFPNMFEILHGSVMAKIGYATGHAANAADAAKEVEAWRETVAARSRKTA